MLTLLEHSAWDSLVLRATEAAPSARARASSKRLPRTTIACYARRIVTEYYSSYRMTDGNVESYYRMTYHMKTATLA